MREKHNLCVREVVSTKNYKKLWDVKGMVQLNSNKNEMQKTFKRLSKRLVGQMVFYLKHLLMN